MQTKPYAVLNVTGYKDNTHYEDIDEDDLGKGDVNTADGGTWERGDGVYGTIHKTYYILQNIWQGMGNYRQKSQVGLQGGREQHKECTEK